MIVWLQVWCVVVLKPHIIRSLEALECWFHLMDLSMDCFPSGIWDFALASFSWTLQGNRMKEKVRERNTQERFGRIWSQKHQKVHIAWFFFFIPRDKRTWKLSSYYLPSLPETTGLDNTTVCLSSYSPSWYPGKSQPFHMPSSKG